MVPAASGLRTLAVGAMLALAACALQPRVDAWQGRSVDELVATWGPPSRSATLQNGQQVLSYSHTSYFAGMSYECNVVFVADPAGRIFDAKMAGSHGGCSRLLDSKPR